MSCPITHDEVVHMKGSVLGKMPGDPWQKFAGVRGFYAYALAHPGKKLSFMGVELGTEAEWAFDKEPGLGPAGAGAQPPASTTIIREASTAFYHEQSPLWEVDFDCEGFQWLVSDDNHNNVVVFLRRDKTGNELVCAINFSPNTYEDYRFGCPPVREYVEVFNSDRPEYGGSGAVNAAPCKVSWKESHGMESSVAIRIPPFGAVFLKGQGKMRAKPKPRKKAKEAAAAEKPEKKASRSSPPAPERPRERTSRQGPGEKAQEETRPREMTD